MNSLAKVSVIVPIKNEEKKILLLLSSFEKLSVYPSEIILVDGGSVDGTVSIINQYLKNANTPYSIRLIEAKQAFPGKGRNIGIKQAKNDIIACTDAGVKLDKDWLNLLIKPFEEEGVDVVIGDFKPLYNTFFEKCGFYIAPKGLRKKDVVFSGCASIAFKKHVWQKIAGFREDLYPCEDKVFLQRIQELNFNVKNVPEAIVYWRARSNIAQLAKQCFNYAFSDGKIGLARKNHAFRALFYIGIIFFLLVSTSKVFSILALGGYFLYSAILAYLLIGSFLVFLYIPWMILTKDLSQIVGFIIGTIKGMGIKRSPK